MKRGHKDSEFHFFTDLLLSALRELASLPPLLGFGSSPVKTAAAIDAYCRESWLKRLWHCLGCAIRILYVPFMGLHRDSLHPSLRALSDIRGALAMPRGPLSDDNDADASLQLWSWPMLAFYHSANYL
jgi:hypothetical protein